MLSKQYNPKRLSFPVYVSEKLDGVAAEFYVPLDSNSGDVLVRSRQNKPILSVQHICDALKDNLYPGEHLVGELYIQGAAFKDISGKVRSHDPQTDLILCVYDMYTDSNQYLAPFERRLAALIVRFPFVEDCVVPIQHTLVKTREELDEYTRNFFFMYPYSEGLMIRSQDHWYAPGKRSWGMMKLKQRDTVDLEIVDIEEATDEAGNPKGMAGGFKCKYKGNIIGVGPGKLTHAERVAAFANRETLIGTIVEVAYMPDPAYEALREPTVLRLRSDKDEPNEE